MALQEAAATATPGGQLAAVQAVWSEVAGSAVAEEAQPVSEREGVVTVACRSAAWVQELELLAGDLTERLNGRLDAAHRVAGLRFRMALRGRS